MGVLTSCKGDTHGKMEINIKINHEGEINRCAFSSEE